jgi:hypothetical protein|tara:strand:+ start:1689 stop:2282 length:594 start_codon:yes stop_codon:yes gene_type:complete
LKGFFKNIQNLLIVVLVIILLLRSCGGDKDIIGTKISKPTTITKVEIRYDTIQTVVNKYIPKWRDRIVIKTDTILASIDTLAILKDYYAKYVYSDTLMIDTVGYAIINDTITRNSIFSRNVTTNILIPTITQTNTVYINKSEWYWGLNLTGRSSQINYLGGGLLYKSKNKNIYGLGAGVNQNFQPVISASYYMKIGK